MKLYAIKFQNEAIKENDWFKSLGCAISGITHFEGRVVESIVERNGGGLSGPWYTHSEDKTHAGKTGMELKLWWAGQQLWCLHILGPDDVIPAPSKAHAEQAAQKLNAWIAGQAWSEYTPRTEAVAAHWPHDAESHAEAVGTFIEQWLTPSDEAQTLTEGGAA